MTEPDKRCGTCRFYRPVAWGRADCGVCNWQFLPMPDAFPCSENDMLLMGPNGGTTCPCWEAKE